MQVDFLPWGNAVLGKGRRLWWTWRWVFQCLHNCNCSTSNDISNTVFILFCCLATCYHFYWWGIIHFIPLRVLYHSRPHLVCRVSILISMKLHQFHSQLVNFIFMMQSPARCFIFFFPVGFSTALGDNSQPSHHNSILSPEWKWEYIADKSTSLSIHFFSALDQTVESNLLAYYGEHGLQTIPEVSLSALMVFETVG